MCGSGLKLISDLYPQTVILIRLDKEFVTRGMERDSNVTRYTWVLRDTWFVVRRLLYLGAVEN
jgi:hypothetical protein